MKGKKILWEVLWIFHRRTRYCFQHHETAYFLTLTMGQGTKGLMKHSSPGPRKLDQVRLLVFHASVKIWQCKEKHLGGKILDSPNLKFISFFQRVHCNQYQNILLLDMLFPDSLLYPCTWSHQLDLGKIFKKALTKWNCNFTILRDLMLIILKDLLEVLVIV